MVGAGAPSRLTGGVRWFTADLHLGHANIIGYCDRPFASVAEMDDALVERWNEAVGPDDEVWVLGDVALGPIEASLARVGELAGRKVLVAGNHDRCWAGHTGRAGERAPEWAERYREAGFAEIHQGTVELELAGRRVLADHFPYQGDSHPWDRYTAQRPIDDGRTWLLHGHVHTRWQVQGRMVNVGVDVWDYRPVAEGTLAEQIAAGPTDGAGTGDRG